MFTYLYVVCTYCKCISMYKGIVLTQLQCAHDYQALEHAGTKCATQPTYSQRVLLLVQLERVKLQSGTTAPLRRATS